MGSLLAIGAGVVLLVLGGEWVVRASVSIAIRLGLSKMLVGMVIIGFGTSLPELFVSVNAAISNSPDIAIGNVVGSNIANFLLILGVGALITAPQCKDSAMIRDVLATLGASVILLAVASNGSISTWEGVAMLGALCAYLAYCILWGRQTSQEDIPPANQSITMDIIISLVGVIMLVLGAHWLVEGASTTARHLGISEAVIGLSLVALGTSLPELAVTIVAAYKKQSEVILGNVMGSTLFNILSILGITALITPLPVAKQISTIDIPLSLGIVAGVAFIILTIKHLPRSAGGIMLASYIGYIAWLYTIGGAH